MLKIVSIVAVVSIGLVCCGGVINHLNESEYARMPPLFHLDPYKECLLDGGEYCSLRMQLVSDQPSHLLKTIEQYSTHRTHFNHSVLNYGICVTKTCKHFLQTNKTRDPRETLESCLNSTMWKDYRLRTKLTEEPSCHKASENGETIGVLDVMIAVLLGLVLVLNLVGSLREFSACEKDNSILSSFSLKRNWRTLTRPSKGGIKSFSGIRSLTSMFVISVHSLLPYFISSVNTRDWEETCAGFLTMFSFTGAQCRAYKHIKYVGTGSLIIQSFFAMSGFLMAYNMRSSEKEKRESCLSLTIRILRRWFRLAPPCLVVLALTVTWLRFAGSGPLWQLAVGDHIEACRRNWWLVPLNIINYADHTQCFIEYWYIAADMQLSILGLVVIGLLRGRARWWTLGFLLLASLIVSAAHTWVQDLDGWLLLTPEFSRTVFLQNPATEYATDPTFSHMYKRGHTNVPAYVIGAACGLLACRWQRHRDEKDHGKLQKYRLIYWSSFPLMVAAGMMGSLFFDAESTPPLAARVAYCLLGRVAFGGSVAVLLAGLTLKMDNVYRGILEWDGWSLTARLSYCAYVVHVALIRLHAGSQYTLTTVSFVNGTWLVLGTEVAAFLVAVPLWLFIEAPAHGVVTHLTRRNTAPVREEPADKNGEEKHTVLKLITKGH